MGGVHLGLQDFERLYDTVYVGRQRLQSLLALGGFSIGVLGEVMNDKGRETEEDEVGLGEVAVSEIGVALLVVLESALFKTDEFYSGRVCEGETYLLEKRAGSADPVLERDLVVVGELVGFFRDLGDAHRPLRKSPGVIHLGELSVTRRRGSWQDEGRPDAL